MFETAMLDSTARARWQRRWATLLSVIVQIVVVGVLLLLPVIAPDSIPRLRLIEPLLAPQPEAASPEPGAPPAGGSTNAATQLDEAKLQQPWTVPETIDMSVNDVSERPSSYIPSGNCVAPCIGGSTLGVRGGTGTGSDFIPTLHEPEPPPKRVIVSDLDPGFLLHRVQPIYPPIAKQAGVQGPVMLRAVIGRNGEIQELRVISGHPLLSSAARDAVQQWRYRPYLLNRAPVEVETQITVNFVLAGR